MLSSLRKRCHLSQTDLAARLGMASSYLCRMESGARPIPIDVAHEIAEVLQLEGEDRLAFYEWAAESARSCRARRQQQPARDAA